MTLWTLVMGLGFAAIVAYQLWRSERGEDVMQRVASELGLQVERSGKRSRLYGRLDDIGVEVRHVTERTAGNVSYYTRFNVFAPDAPPGRIEAASLRQRVLNSLSEEQALSTGDSEFDQAVRVYGPEQTMRAALDGESRQAVRSATDAGWSLDSARWTAIESGFVTDAAALRSLLELGLAAHRATRMSGTDPARRPATQVVSLAEQLALDAPPPPSSLDEARAWLASGEHARAFEAAVMLATAGERGEQVRLALVGALPDQRRQARAIAALAQVGNRIDVMMLRAVRGEHQAAAEAAAKEIERRL